jgi:methylase of polypeptide subunit release factors
MPAVGIYESGEYLAQNPTWHVEDSEWKASKVLKALERLKIAPASLCEIGCGAGEILRQLHSHLPDCKFTGYEISPQAYALAKNVPPTYDVVDHYLAGQRILETHHG